MGREPTVHGQGHFFPAGIRLLLNLDVRSRELQLERLRPATTQLHRHRSRAHAGGLQVPGLELRFEGGSIGPAIQPRIHLNRTRACRDPTLHLRDGGGQLQVEPVASDLTPQLHR